MTVILNPNHVRLLVFERGAEVPGEDVRVQMSGHVFSRYSISARGSAYRSLYFAVIAYVGANRDVVLYPLYICALLRIYETRLIDGSRL